jgi:hypothetical protein
VSENTRIERQDLNQEPGEERNDSLPGRSVVDPELRNWDLSLPGLNLDQVRQDVHGRMKNRLAATVQIFEATLRTSGLIFDIDFN